MVRVGDYSLRAIAAVLGVSATTVHRDMKSAQPDPAPYVRGRDGKIYPVTWWRGRTDARDALIRAARAEGLSLRNIADDIGVSIGTVHRVCGRARAVQTPVQTSSSENAE